MVRHLSNVSPCHAVLVTYNFSQGLTRNLKEDHLTIETTFSTDHSAYYKRMFIYYWSGVGRKVGGLPNLFVGREGVYKKNHLIRGVYENV